MNKQLTTVAFLVATAATVAGTAQAFGQETFDRPDAGTGRSYTVLDHPSEPCHLSEEAVANWGETSAHLPQACTYGD